VREPEGIETPLPGRSSEKDLVITPRTRRSHRRGRGFESFHLHRSEIPGQGRFSNEERYDGFVKVVAEALISQTDTKGRSTLR
jgi:hypothetical protein